MLEGVVSGDQVRIRYILKSALTYDLCSVVAGRGRVFARQTSNKENAGRIHQTISCVHRHRDFLGGTSIGLSHEPLEVTQSPAANPRLCGIMIPCASQLSTHTTRGPSMANRPRKVILDLQV